MSKITPIEAAFGEPIRRTALFTIYSTGKLRYTAAGEAKFGPRFKRWGINIRKIKTSKDHFTAVSKCEDLELTDLIENGPEISDPNLTEEFLTQLLESASKTKRQTIREVLQSQRESTVGKEDDSEE